MEKEQLDIWLKEHRNTWERVCRQVASNVALTGDIDGAIDKLQAESLLIEDKLIDLFDLVKGDRDLFTEFVEPLAKIISRNFKLGVLYQMNKEDEQ